MVDQALPRRDRIELTEAERIAIAAERLAAAPPTTTAPPLERSANPVVGVTLDAREWRRLIGSVPAAPPLVDRVLKAIRPHVATTAGAVTVCGSALGWCALLSYLLDRRICPDLGARITAAVGDPRSLITQPNYNKNSKSKRKAK